MNVIKLSVRTIANTVKPLILILIVASLSGCASFDRMLNPISDHTKHYSFTHHGAVNGGLLVGGVVESFEGVDIVAAVENAQPVANAFGSERKQFTVNSAAALRDLLGDDVYRTVLQRYDQERWVDPQILAKIRDNLPQRYVAFARVEEISERRSSSCYKEKKKKKKDKDGKETDEYEDGPDKYGVSRSSQRTAKISVDVFDLAQDIIVWSGTRDNLEMNSEYYDSRVYVGEDSYLSRYPYPAYPSWYATYYGTARGLAVHFPHKSD